MQSSKNEKRLAGVIAAAFKLEAPSLRICIATLSYCPVAKAESAYMHLGWPWAVRQCVDTQAYCSISFHPFPFYPIDQMSAPLSWNAILFPDQQTARIVPQLVDETIGTSHAATSTFHPNHLDITKLPVRVRLLPELPGRMDDHLRLIVNDHYTEQAAATELLNGNARWTPTHYLEQLQSHCALTRIYYSTESQVRTVATWVASMARNIYRGLTGTENTTLGFDTEIPNADRTVRTDVVYLLDNSPKYYGRISR